LMICHFRTPGLRCIARRNVSVDTRQNIGLCNSRLGLHLTKIRIYPIGPAYKKERKRPSNDGLEHAAAAQVWEPPYR
jgi:hypothetical protein